MVKPVSRDQNRKPNSDELPLQRACHREHSLFAERAPDDLDSDRQAIFIGSAWHHDGRQSRTGAATILRPNSKRQFSPLI
jgi:hypothetical protein